MYFFRIIDNKLIWFGEKAQKALHSNVDFAM